MSGSLSLFLSVPGRPASFLPLCLRFICLPFLLSVFFLQYLSLEFNLLSRVSSRWHRNRVMRREEFQCLNMRRNVYNTRMWRNRVYLANMLSVCKVKDTEPTNWQKRVVSVQEADSASFQFEENTPIPCSNSNTVTYTMDLPKGKLNLLLPVDCVWNWGCKHVGVSS